MAGRIGPQRRWEVASRSRAGRLRGGSPTPKPRNRANRRCRCWAYHPCRPGPASAVLVCRPSSIPPLRLPRPPVLRRHSLVPASPGDSIRTTRRMPRSAEVTAIRGRGFSDFSPLVAGARGRRLVVKDATYASTATSRRFMAHPRGLPWERPGRDAGSSLRRAPQRDKLDFCWEASDFPHRKLSIINLSQGGPGRRRRPANRHRYPPRSSTGVGARDRAEEAKDGP